jgi:hypothetical protein
VTSHTWEGWDGSWCCKPELLFNIQLVYIPQWQRKLNSLDVFLWPCKYILWRICGLRLLLVSWLFLLIFWPYHWYRCHHMALPMTCGKMTFSIKTEVILVTVHILEYFVIHCIGWLLWLYKWYIILQPLYWKVKRISSHR